MKILWNDPRDLDGDNLPYVEFEEDGILVRDYCSCEGPDHDYDCELDELLDV